MRDKRTIEAKWWKKMEEMRMKADFKFNILLQNRRKKYESNWEWEVEKNEKKKAAYIRQKEEMYRRKMLNEIREWEWKAPREYKTDWPNIKPLEFALKIAQENARLRDTDEDGKWRCVSCNRLCDWEWLAGGHRYSRKFTNMCLEKENINAQCHTCNFTTWPRGNPALKLKTNEEYDRNIEKRWWEWSVEKLKKKVMEFTSWKSVKYDLCSKLPDLIEENERLWWEKSPSFLSNHKPGKKWRELWNEYVKRHPQYRETLGDVEE